MKKRRKKQETKRSESDKRNSNYLGKGLFSTTFGKEIQGKRIVVKRISRIFPKEEAMQTIEWHSKYLETLKRFGVNVPATEIRAYKKKEGYSLTIFQERFEKSEFVSTILRNSPRQEALSTFKKISEQIANLIKLNQAWKRDTNSFIWADLHPYNLARREGRIYVTDTFFPLIMIEGKSSRKAMEQHLEKQASRLHIIQKRMSNAAKFEPGKSLRWFLAISTEIRPNLKTGFEEITRETIKKNFSMANRSKMLHSISPVRMELLKAYYYFVQRFVLKQKGMLGQNT